MQTKIGVSALSIQRITSVNYAAAWLLLQKMRVAMNQDERTKLSGDVEFDETYVGGVELGAGGRSRGKKSPVAAACEVVSPKAMGRIRLARLPDASALAIVDFLERNIEPGSVLLCDDWASYAPALGELRARGLHYTTKTTTLSKTKTRAHLIHPHVHRVASLLKRWLLGTHQGAVRDQHLDAYLDVRLSLQPATLSQLRPHLLATRLQPDGEPLSGHQSAIEAATSRAGGRRRGSLAQGHHATKN